MDFTFIYVVPIWVCGLVFAAMLLISLEVGYRVGLVRREQLVNPEAGGGGVVLTSMFALLGLILAFTYGFTVNRYEQRRQSVIREANALGTAFLRAGLIDGEEAAALRVALRDYTETRVITREVSGVSSESVQLSMKAQSRLWPLTERIVKSKDPTPVDALLVASVNEVIDMHTNRAADAFDRLPAAIYWILSLIASVSISVAGFNAGLGGFISRWRMSGLTIVLAAVMLVIIDFDRPLHGFIRTNQDPLRAAVQDMNARMSTDR